MANSSTFAPTDVRGNQKDGSGDFPFSLSADTFRTLSGQNLSVRAVYLSRFRNAVRIVSMDAHNMRTNANCASSVIWIETNLALLASPLPERANYFTPERVRLEKRAKDSQA
jgi:hypothetical protein